MSSTTINHNPGQTSNYTLKINKCHPIHTDEMRCNFNGRLVVNAGCDSDCCSYFTTTIRNFVSHRYADFRMFWRSVSSMGNGTTMRVIDRRVNEVVQFIYVLENSSNHPIAVRERFHRLSPEVRDLFFYVDESYIDNFVQNPARNAEMIQEIIREAEHLVRFQTQLTAVNAFYRMFVGESADSTVQIPISVHGNTQPGASTTHLNEDQIPEQPFRWMDWFGGVFNGGFRPHFAGTQTDLATSSVTPAPASSIILDIPGTVPYIRNAIPVEVQQKADEISRLRDRFAAMPNPPPIPINYKDVIMGDDFMTLPIFDASHPSVQSSLQAGASSRSIQSDLSAYHLFEKDSLEGHISSIRNSWSRAKCPICRHPENGEIGRPYLRIHTLEQDRILQFLRNATRATS